LREDGDEARCPHTGEVYSVQGGVCRLHDTSAPAASAA
jgi:hypothetical protein